MRDVKHWLVLMAAAWFGLVAAARGQDAPTGAATTAETQSAEEMHDDHATPSAVDAHGHDNGHEHDDGHAHGDGDHGHDDHPKLGAVMPRIAIVPFALLLLSIAIFPLANPHWWEHNSNKGIIAAVLGVPTAAYLASFGEAGLHAMQHAGMEFVSFLLLLGSLFVISGGVYVRGSLNGTPFLNTMFLLIGGLIASFVGTTGASMLLIRPLLRANAKRTRVAHIVVFFIFVVSNCGGLLTPLGDPPLFLGFLKGVPFTWTFRLTPHWALVNSILLVIFFIWDSLVAKQEEPNGLAEDPEAREPFGLVGTHNFLFLLAIVAIIYCSGQGIGNDGVPWPWGISEALMAITGLVSYLMTSSSLREMNRFTFHPIIEVAVLFAGIFITMIPALAILNVEGKNLGLTETWHFFWATGILSSFLDNAPTYLTFAVTAAGIHNIPDTGLYLREFLALPPETGNQAILAAISCGAVFMGANSYIGNGPNFMVKAIAEENGIRMPGFFAYMLYSTAILVPIFVVVTVVFFA